MFEAYKIGITLSLTNHVSKGLMLMAGDFENLEKRISGSKARLSELQNMALKGGLMVGAGVGIFSMFKAPYEEAKKLAQAKADFATMNLSTEDNASVYAKAATMSHKILGTTITENIKQIQDLHTVFGELGHALEYSDVFARYSKVMQYATGKPVDGLISDAAKALEHRGSRVLNNPVEFEDELNRQAQVSLATKNRVNSRSFREASNTGKMAYSMFDKEYLYGDFAGLMSVNGAAQSGTAAMTGFSSLIGGHMDGKAKGFLAELGLWQEGLSKTRLKIMHDAMKGVPLAEQRSIIASMGGQAVISGGLKDADAELFAHRPDLFAQKLVPLVRQRYGLNLTDEQVALEVTKNFNKNSGMELGQLITLSSKLQKDSAIFNKTMNIEGAYKAYMKTPAGAEGAASAAWNNFLAMFGSVYLPQITKGLLGIAGAFDSLSDWIGKHPTITKGIVSSLETLAGAMLIKGSINLLASGIKGLGLIAQVNGVTQLASVSSGFSSLGKTLQTTTNLCAAFSAGWTVGTLINDWLQKFPDACDLIGQSLTKLIATVDVFNVTDAQDSLNRIAKAKLAAAANESASQVNRYNSFIKSGASKNNMMVQTSINIDGRKFMETVTPYLAAPLGASNFGSGSDLGLAMPMPGNNR